MLRWRRSSWCVLTVVCIGAQEALPRNRNHDLTLVMTLLSHDLIMGRIFKLAQAPGGGPLPPKLTHVGNYDD